MKWHKYIGHKNTAMKKTQLKEMASYRTAYLLEYWTQY